MIEAIYIAKQKGEPQVQVNKVELVANEGIVGDRNYRSEKWPGQNITFVEAEEIDNFNSMFGRNIGYSETRRNIVTRGVRLNDLVGKQFYIGGNQFYGVELCEPCKILGTLLATDFMPIKDVIKAWVHKGGLRANVLSNGVITVGMEFTNEPGA